MYAKGMSPLLFRCRSIRMLAETTQFVRAISSSSEIPTIRRPRGGPQENALETTPDSPSANDPDRSLSLLDEADKIVNEFNLTRKQGDGERNNNSDNRLGPTSLLGETTKIFEEQAQQRSKLSSRELEKNVPTTDIPASLENDELSLFDVFKVPEPTAPRDPDAFDDKAYRSYRDKIDEIIAEDRKFLREHTRRPIPPETAAPVIEWLRQNKTVVPHRLPVFDKALKEGVDELGDTVSVERYSFRNELAEQQERFCKELGFNQVQYKLAKSGLTRTVRMCAKRGMGLPASVIWEKTREAGARDENFLRTLLHVSSTYQISTKRGSSQFSFMNSILHSVDAEEKNESHSDQEEATDTVDEVAIYHDLLFEPTEQSLTVRLRLLVSQGKAAGAYRVLEKYSEKLRLRACTPVLRLLLEQGHFSSALRLFSRMQQMPLVFLEAETFLHLLTGIAENGYFSDSSPAIVGAKDLGYTVESGPELFDQIVSQMLEESIIELSMASARRLYNALAKGFPESGLVKTSLFAPLKPKVTEVKKSDLLASVVRIEHSSGKCPLTGVSLRLITLKDDERTKLRASLLELARITQKEHEEKFRSKKNAPNKAKRVKANQYLEQFLHALDERSGEPFTAIVDGPNVGYHLQNFEKGRFSFHQIKFVVDALKKMGEHPLVILPQKYTRYNNFRLATGFRGDKTEKKQELTKEEVQIKNELMRSGSVYIVPYGNLDDYYWISASIAEQTKSRKGESLAVAVDNTEGRWPGARPILVSNDQMRDHRLGMMEPMLYRRWYSNYMVNYSFPPFVDGECLHPEISFAAADIFSREIQSNKMPDGSVVWHFPIEESEEEWFCIRIPKRVN